MPKRKHAHEIVSRQGWLSFTPPAFRQIVLERCKSLELKAEATIYSVGDPPGGMYGLVRGNMAISIAPGERGPLIAHFAQPGTWLGEAAAFTDQPRRIGLAAVAHNDVAIGGADDLLIRDHVKRSVAVLLRLGGCRYRTPEGAAPIEVDVSQEDFAAMSNVARTTAGTVLRKFEAEGFVAVSYRCVRILAPDALRVVLEA